MSDSQNFGSLVANGDSRVMRPASGRRVVQAVLTGTGALTADVSVYGSCVPPVNGVGQNGVLLGTMLELTGNDSVTGAVVSEAPYPYVWATIADLTGTGATLTLYLGT